MVFLLIYFKCDFIYEVDGSFLVSIIVYFDLVCVLFVVSYDFVGYLMWYVVNLVVVGVWL